MRVTDRTRLALRFRRTERNLLAKGWEEIGERGGKLWELYRGGRIGHAITDVVIMPGGKSLFVKISAPAQTDSRSNG